MKNQKAKQVDYSIPMFIALVSLGLYVFYEITTSIFYRMICVYLFVTVLFPIIATWTMNLILAPRPPKKQSSKNTKKQKMTSLYDLFKSLLKSIVGLFVGLASCIGFYYFNDWIVGLVMLVSMYGITKLWSNSYRANKSASKGTQTIQSQNNTANDILDKKVVNFENYLKNKS